MKNDPFTDVQTSEAQARLQRVDCRLSDQIPSFSPVQTQLWPSSTDNDTENKKALAEAKDAGERLKFTVCETGELMP